MGRVILPCGNDARTPYYLEGLKVRVYTVEELCYVLREHAFLLESSVMDKKLAAWIEGECGLRELAGTLQSQLAQKEPLSRFVMTILEYVGYYGQAALRETEDLLLKGQNLSSYEKDKVRIDGLVESGRFGQALEEYDALLQALPEVENVLSARILHNMGAAHAGLFRFGQAAECFLKSFEMHPLQETYLHYLGARRMQLEDKEYVDFVANLPDAYSDSLELEKRVEALRQSWKESLEYQRLEQMKDWRCREESGKWQDETENMLQGLKQRYRLGSGEI